MCSKLLMFYLNPAAGNDDSTVQGVKVQDNQQLDSFQVPLLHTAAACCTILNMLRRTP